MRDSEWLRAVNRKQKMAYGKLSCKKPQDTDTRMVISGYPSIQSFLWKVENCSQSEMRIDYFRLP